MRQKVQLLHFQFSFPQKDSEACLGSPILKSWTEVLVYTRFELLDSLEVAQSQRCSQRYLMTKIVDACEMLSN